jgi:ribosomal protein L37AE/L43A
LFEPAGEPTLDDLISKAWQTLVIRGSAHCPVCGATLVRDDVTSTASCERCGSVLD